LSKDRTDSYRRLCPQDNKTVHALWLIAKPIPQLHGPLSSCHPELPLRRIYLLLWSFYGKKWLGSSRGMCLQDGKTVHALWLIAKPIPQLQGPLSSCHPELFLRRIFLLYGISLSKDRTDSSRGLCPQDNKSVDGWWLITKPTRTMESF